MAAASELYSKEGKNDYYARMADYIKDHFPDRNRYTHIYPRFPEKHFENKGNIKGQDAERLVYDVLKEIKDQPMLILYSYKFPVARNGEIDFLLVHLRKGVIILEVKAWEEINPKEKAKAVSNIQKKAAGVKIKLRNSKLITRKFLHIPRCGFVLPNISIQNMDGYCFKENLQDSRTFMQWLDETFDDIEHHGEDLFDKSLCALFDVAVNSKSYDGITEELLLLTPEQCQAVDGCPCEQVIVGPAGSGKTEVLINKVLSEELKNQKKLVICFTRALSDHLRVNRLNEACNVTVCTFSKLVREIAGDDLDISMYEREKDVFSYALLKAYVSDWRGYYDSVFIDEAQDLPNGWFSLIHTIHNKGEDHYLWIFCDPNQKTYWNQNDIDISNAYTLRHVIRNTVNVFNVSKRFYKLAKPISVKHKFKGPDVDWIFVNPGYGPETMQKLLDKICEASRECRPLETPGEACSLQTGDVTILLENDDMRGVFLKAFENYDTAQYGGPQLTCLSAERMVFQFNSASQHSVDCGKNFVTVSTIRKFKGLESKVVILFLLSDLSKRSMFGLMYVGVTRSICKLIIFCPHSWQKLENIQDIIPQPAQASPMEEG